MWGVALPLFLLVRSIQARTVQRYEEPEKNVLASLLLAPTSAATLRPSAAASSATKRVAKHAPAMQEGEAASPKFDVKDMSGVTAPLGFFDPFGYSKGVSKGKILFYREVELKHGRVAMLAALGFLIAEQFHPLFGGNIDVPSLIAFQQTPLESYWAIAVGIPLLLAIPEVFSVFTFKPPNEALWEMREDRVSGDLGFDPLNLKPKDPKGFKEMQTKEINNGRLAMIAFAGMVYQEALAGGKLF
jgi:hypothetical protein